MNDQSNNKYSNLTHQNKSASRIKETNPYIIVGQILTIIAASMWCLTIIGMIWGIPMIIGCNQRLNRVKDITIFHIVLSIIFFWLIAGILTLIGAAQETRI